jgi:hypothetical protein
MPREFFEEAADALIGFLPAALASFSRRITSANLKVWYGDDTREHYEIQLAGGRLEIGFHAEHPDPARNDIVLERLLEREGDWRRSLGRQAEIGPYLGRQAKAWRRVSEVWDDEELDSGAAVEAADRLAVYIEALEAPRRGVRARGERRARR